MDGVTCGLRLEEIWSCQRFRILGQVVRPLAGRHYILRHWAGGRSGLWIVSRAFGVVPRASRT